MAKPKREQEDKFPSFPATPAYKQWVWEEIRRRHWTLQALVDEMKRVDRGQTGGAVTVTTTNGTLAQLLGPEDAVRRFRTNTDLMPSINAALEIAQPPVCDPESPLAQLKDRLDALWQSMDAGERERFLLAMEATLNLAAG